jgi:hypothetical protein
MEKAQKETEEVSFSSQREEMDPAMVWKTTEISWDL